MNIFYQYTIKIKKFLNELKSRGKIVLPSNLDSLVVDIPPKDFLGDISCNVAMIISKVNKKGPFDIANLISKEIVTQGALPADLWAAVPAPASIKADIKPP